MPIPPRPEGQGARTLCLCADDFGLHQGINTAVQQLVTLQRVHAVGCMVGAPAWREGSRLARRWSPAEVDVGLHLDLTEFPLLGGARPVGAWIRASYLGRLELLRVSAEIGAQLDAFEHGIGRAPTFVDGHQHVHQLPGVREVLLGELARRYAGGQPWLRSTTPPGAAGPAVYGGWRGMGKARLIGRLGAAGLSRLARRQGFARNCRLLGVYGFQADHAAYLALLAACLRVGQDGDLLMCHPGVGVDASDPIHAARQVEFEVLSGPEWGLMLMEQGVVLRPMGRILEG